MPRVLTTRAVRDRDTVAHARAMIGRVLAMRTGGGIVRRRITEAEAYDGQEDRACHASRGRTSRTEVMFQPGGVWYVYLCYGMHEMLNLVTGPRDYPAAVLIRGVEGSVGPGRLTRALGIDRRFNALPATRATGLWIEDDGFVPPAGEMRAAPRIGVESAEPEWAGKPWRFTWKLNDPSGAPREGMQCEKPDGQCVRFDQ